MAKRLKQMVSAAALGACLSSGLPAADQPAQAEAPWCCVAGNGAGAKLIETDEGLSLSDIAGDTWGGQNSQRAVFTRPPSLPVPYYFQATFSQFEPRSASAQVGLVAWGDQDNYVRATLGFVPNGLESVGEFDGHAVSRGLRTLAPEKLPTRMTLRVEVHERSIRCYASRDGRYWLATGGFELPQGRVAREWVQGIGLIGVGGEMAQPPLVTRWTEGPLAADFLTDEFNRAHLGRQWLTGQTNGGWGREEVRVGVGGGRLLISPFPGSDLFFGVANYPFAAQPAPAGEQWELELQLKDFDAQAPGNFHKGGLMLWTDEAHYFAFAVVVDEALDQIYFEALAEDGAGQEGKTLKREGFHLRKLTDAWLRVVRESGGAYLLRGSWNGTDWSEVARIKSELPDAQLRLFGTCDVFRQAVRDPHKLALHFDHLRLIKGEARVDE